MEIIKIAVFGILVALFAVEMKSHKPLYGILITVATVIFILILSFDKIELLLSQLQKLIEKTGNDTHIGVLFKALGVSYVCEISSGICQDAGFSSLASQIKIFAKVYIVILGLPILLAFVDVLEHFMG